MLVAQQGMSSLLNPEVSGVKVPVRPGGMFRCPGAAESKASTRITRTHTLIQYGGSLC